MLMMIDYNFHTLRHRYGLLAHRCAVHGRVGCLSQLLLGFFFFSFPPFVKEEYRTCDG